MSADVFPAFIRAEYDPSGDGFPAFERAAEQASARARQRFEADMDSVRQAISNALSVPRNSVGSLDLGVEQQRAAANALQAQATAAREVAEAMRQAAAAAGDQSQKARLALAAAEALEVEYRREAQAALTHVEALEQVQAQLNKTASATDAVVASMRRGTTGFGAVTNSARSLRFAGLQASQQVQDMVVQFEGGAKASLIMAQQLPQLAFALSGVEGEAGSLAARVGALGRFFAGGWGTAIFIAVAALGPYVAKMIDAASETDKLEKNLEKAAAAADSFGAAETMLGKIIDLTTGKLKTHNEVLIQAIKLEAQAKLASADQRISDFGKKTGTIKSGIDLTTPTPGTTGLYGLPGGDIDKAVAAGAKIARQKDQLDAILRGLSTAINNDTLAASDPSAYSKSIGTALDTAIDKVDKLAVAGKVAGKNLLEVKQQIIAAGTAANDKAAALESLAVIAGGPIPDDLKPYHKPRKPRKTPDLDRMSESAAEAIARINAAWDEQPRLIDRAVVDTLKLDNLMKDLQRRKPPGYEKLIADARAAKSAITDGLQRPYEQFVDQQNEQLEIQRLVNAGRIAEAEALQNILSLQREMGPLTETQKRNILDMAVARQREAEAAELERQRQQAFLGALQQTQQVIAQSIATLRTGGPSGFLKTLFGGAGSTLDQLVGNYVTTKVFGPMFQALSDEVKGTTPIDRANYAVAGKIDSFGATVARMTTSADALPGATDRVMRSLDRLVDALDTTSARMRGTGLLAANDNGLAGLSSVNGPRVDLPVGSDGNLLPPDVVVTAQRLKSVLQDPFGFSGETLAKTLQSALTSVGIHISDDSVKALGGTFSTAIEGLYAGQVAGGLILGSHGDRTGEALGGIAGEALGKSLTKGLTGILGKIGGPIGGAVGGILGGLVGSLFHSAQQGGVTLTGSGSGSLFGNNAAARQNAGSLAQSVQSGLQNIIDQLGGTLGSYLVSIGTYNGKYRVNPNGGTKLGGGGGKLGNVDFGDDEQAAIQYAILNAIQDGAVKGIDAGAQRLLQAGNDLNVQLQKALSFEQVFKDLKAHTDPVGAAIDAVNAKFENLKKIFAEAGASTEQYAQLEQEYQFERADAIKQAEQQAIGSLKDLLSQLTTGDNGRSLRDRVAAAKAAYDPLAAQIAAGDYSNADEYSSAAQTLLDLTRQMDGSQQGYFDLLDQVTALTRNAVDAQQKLIDNATNASTPFSDASGTKAVTGSIDTMNTSLTGQLAATNKNLGTMIAQNDNILQALTARGLTGRANF